MRFKGFPYCWGAIAATKCIKAIVFVFLPGKAGDKDGDAGKGDKTVKNPPIWTKVKNLFTDYYNDLTKE